MNAGLRKVRRQNTGFTIVETMIVLAVTGALFVMIASTLSGRQNAAEFTHGIQSVQSQIQQIVNQVSTGFYPNKANFSCKQVGNSVVINGGANKQGTNGDCVYLGKVIQFSVSGTSPEAYRVYTIAGLRNAASGTTSPFKNDDPTVVWWNNDYVDYSTSGILEYGLKTQWMRSDLNSSCLSAGCSIGGVGILMEPGNANTQSASGYASGEQQIDVIPLYGTRLQRTPTQTITTIESAAPFTGLRDPNLKWVLNPKKGVQLCFASGSTNQSGLITIGGSGRQLTVSLDIRSNKSCY